MALTAKQQAFVREYLIDLNATQAAIRAGYSPKTAVKIGSENIRKPDVAEAIRLRQAELDAEGRVSVQWVLDRFKAVAERCMQEEAVTDREGNPTGEYRFDSAGANKALDSIGRHLGMFNDKLKLEGELEFRKLEDLL